jgi:preprotein translocase subunit YajC
MGMGVCAVIAQAGGDWRTTMGNLTPIIWIIAFAVIFYFLLIRPQRQRQKAHEEMVKALRSGDKVITQGGLIGTVTKVEPEANTLRLRLAPGMEITMLRSHVAAKSGEETP